MSSIEYIFRLRGSYWGYGSNYISSVCFFVFGLVWELDLFLDRDSLGWVGVVCGKF